MNLGSLGVSHAEAGRDQKPGGLSPVGVSDKKGRGAGSPGIPCRSAGCEPGWWRVILSGQYRIPSLLPVDVVSVVHSFVPGV